jgi:hypothetical protein
LCSARYAVFTPHSLKIQLESDSSYWHSVSHLLNDLQHGLTAPHS